MKRIMALILSLSAPCYGAISASHIAIGDSNPTSSFTPTANALVLVSVGIYSSDQTVTAPSSVSGNGITYTLINNSLNFDTSGDGDTKRIFLYRGMSASPTTGGITITHSESYMSWAISEITGVDTGGSNGSAAVVQSAVNQTNGGTALTATLAAFGSASNGAFGTGYTWGGTVMTPEAGWTELADGNASDFPQTQWRADNDTTASWTFSSDAAGVVAIEVKAPDAGGSPSAPAPRRIIITE